MSALQPYTGKWDRTLAAHLLNRAAFAPLPAELTKAVADGFDKTVDGLFAFEPEIDRLPPPDMPDVPDHPKLQLAGLTPEERKKKIEELNRTNRDAIDDLRGWWIRRMLQSRWPLREKLTLFWHGHLTTSANEVKAAKLLFIQNGFLRHNCAGNLRTLLTGISRDPAMLRYLDNNTSRKEHPNENYARELMELFTLGIGRYSEDDVKAAARAFTGWSFRAEEFEFHQREHDFGTKTFLGETGNFDGDDIIDIMLKQPCTARYIANKLAKFFVSDTPDPDFVESVAGLLRENGFEFRPTLQAIFQSEYFYSAKVYRAQVKCPVQLVVGSARLLGVTLDERALAIAMRTLGQDLFYPPTVKGWDGGETWINTTSLLQRYNFAGFLLSGEMPGQVSQKFRFRIDRFGKPQNEINTIFDKDFADNAPRLVDAMIGRMLQASLDAKARQWLIEQAETTRLSERATRVAHLVMSMPDYQLC